MPNENSTQIEIFTDLNGHKYSELSLFRGISEHTKIEGGFGGSGGVYGNPGCFTGKSQSEKLAMCGINGDWSPESALNRGLITSVSIPCPPRKIEFNKFAAGDLIAILNEINNLGWFRCNISSAFRRNLSAGGHSRHQVGLAVDINAGHAGNPWFAARIGRDFREPAQGSPPPWSFKKYSCGNYDRSVCIWSYDHPVTKIFEAHGWGWGGSYGDVMHFSIDGH